MSGEAFYGARALAAFDLYGIDPEPDTARNELEQARAADMERHGFPARVCVRCKKAYPKMFDCGAICPGCHNFDRKYDAKLREQMKRRRPSSRGDRVPDGLGCSERVPAWTIHYGGRVDG